VSSKAVDDSALHAAEINAAIECFENDCSFMMGCRFRDKPSGKS
jgi:hypothetical protein